MIACNRARRSRRPPDTNVKEGDRSLQVHLFGAEGVSPLGRSPKEDPTRHHIAYAVADLAEAERELKARGIYHWIYESVVSDASLPNLEIFYNP